MTIILLLWVVQSGIESCKREKTSAYYTGYVSKACMLLGEIPNHVFFGSPLPLFLCNPQSRTPIGRSNLQRGCMYGIHVGELPMHLTLGFPAHSILSLVFAQAKGAVKGRIWKDRQVDMNDSSLHDASIVLVAVVLSDLRDNMHWQTQKTPAVTC